MGQNSSIKCYWLDQNIGKIGLTKSGGGVRNKSNKYFLFLHV